MIGRTLACALLVALIPPSSPASPASRAQQAPPAGSFELDELTVTRLQDAMAAGRYTSRRLVELYTQRINAIDHSGPVLRSVIELNPDALSIADALDAERRAGRVRGPLHGIPVVGVSFIGRAWSEATLIRLAFAYEQATRLRRPPQFQPTIPLDGR